MTRVTALPAAGPGEHAVHFYQTDGELASVVGAYLAEGIRSGQGVIVVATAPHRAAFEAALAEAGVDVAREQREGGLLVADAAELLDRFLVGEELSPERFRAVISGLIHRAAAGGRPVRVYGEMVAVLWDAGRVDLALELEKFWNALGEVLPFALLCGYPFGTFASGDAAWEVCGLHSRVIATQSFPAELDSVRAARHVTVGLLGTGADEAAIVVTELTANAVLHARSGFTLTISRSAAGVRIAVRDHCPLVPHDDGRPFDVKTGHGLSVVAHVARSWAVEQLPDGKVVWAELPAG